MPFHDSRLAFARNSVDRSAQLRSQWKHARVRRRSFRHALQGAAGFDPIGKAFAVVAHLGVAQFVEQTDRLRGQMSGEFCAVDSDVGHEIGQQLARVAGDARQRQTNCARNVTGRVGLYRQHIDHSECARLAPLAKFIAGYGRNMRGGRRGFSFGRHGSKSAA